MFGRLIAGVLLTLALHGCGGKPSVVQPPPAGIALNDMCSRYNVSWQWDGVTQVVILEFRNNKAKALVGSNVVLVGKDKIYLRQPLRRVNSTIYVPEDFEQLVLRPLGVVPGTKGLPVDWSRLKVRSIVLDAGHGGKDPGAQGKTTREKEVTLDIAKRVKILLEDAGIKVKMTRTTDVFISLPGRTEIASQTNADLFVSIHANSNPNRKTEGFEVYYVKTNGKSDLDEEQRDRNEKMFARQLNMRNSPVLREVVADMMYTFKKADSGKLARQMVKECSTHLNAANGGARTCRFFVVRNTLMPAVLVEVGYLTNRAEERKLATGAYRQKIAQAIARSIVNYATES